MTETEWMSCSECYTLERKLSLVLRKTEQNTNKEQAIRRQRLIAAAGCRRIWSLLVPPLQKSVELAERYADTGDRATLEEARREQSVAWSELAEAQTQAETFRTGKRTVAHCLRNQIASCALEAVQYLVMSRASESMRAAGIAAFVLTCCSNTVALEDQRDIMEAGNVLDPSASVQEKLAVCEIYRDIFGNPFRPVAFHSSWRTETTVGHASRMYDDRNFAAMPILADALEEAGCDNADILSHCREPGVHVRGCWVVDLVLGKG